ncbi:MAG: hypothetical protein RIQ81_2298 [Pseudomonadota bacterium]|jgi:ABC-type Mn2+/Zn2+ transport system ATPase subunit
MSPEQTGKSLRHLFAFRSCISASIREIQLLDRGPLLRRGFTREFPPGKISLVVAPNGSGKSTLLRCIAGIVEPSTGSIVFQLDGSEIKLPEDPVKKAAVIAWLPAEDDFAFPQDPLDLTLAGRWRFHQGKPSQNDIEAAQACMMATGLPTDLSIPVNQLSSGQKRRLNLARVLCQDADILLLDEPFRGLDNTGRAKVSALLEWLAQAGRTIIIADPLEANPAMQDLR